MAYKQNASSPEPISAKVVNSTDGAPITSGVVAYHIQGTTRTLGAGVLTYVTNGYWSYVPTQAETNYASFSIEFYHISAVSSGPQVTIYTDVYLSEDVVAHGDVSWVDAGLLIGSGSVSVDHNYGGTDNLTYIVDGGAAVEDAIVQAFLKTDYDAGNRTRNYVKGETRTDANGRWDDPLRLDPATYVIVFYKPNEYGPDIAEITVT